MIYQGDYDAAIRAAGGKYKLTDIDSTGATTNQVIKYNGTTVAWGDESVSPGEIALTSAHILVGNGSNVAADVAASGDLTLANTGAFTIANGAVSTAKIANNAVDGTKIAITSQATGSLMYYDGTDWVNLAPGTVGQVLTMAGGIPTWV